MSNVDEFDVGGEAQASPDRLEKLNRALEDATALEIVVENLEEDLKAAKRTLHAIKTGVIPDAMAELMMDSVVWNGWDVKVDDFVSGSLPKDPAKKEAALAWLRENGGEGLIKTSLSVQFGKGEEDAAHQAAESLVRHGYAPSLDLGVHAQTLAAFARERIKEGDAIDTDLLGLYTGRVAKLKRSKGK